MTQINHTHGQTKLKWRNTAIYNSVNLTLSWLISVIWFCIEKFSLQNDPNRVDIVFHIWYNYIGKGDESQ